MNKLYTILYVEDEKSIQDFVSVIFKKNNIKNVTFSANGQEALHLYKEEKFDLVITDMFMPIMDGFKLIQEIKILNPKQIFMMVTGLENKDDLIKAIELRVNFFIEKPIKPKKIMSVLNESFDLIAQKKESELARLLLSQYKHSIDNTALVSKADTQGNITYINTKFEEISQYTQEEIVGKNHRILKHKEMPDKVFKDIWKTISAKKIWSGVITNTAKDGSTYIVDSTIIPLLDLNNNIIEYISIRHDITELELYKNSLQKQLDLAVSEVIDTQKEVVYTMGAIGETRSKETGNHVKRVANYSYILAKLAGVSEANAQLLKLASPMHDIGKVGIPDNILNKPGKLTPDEFEIMKEHAYLGYEMLKSSSRDILKTSAIVAYEHHERWDGKGYPRAIEGENIHIFGRITAICDVFDALGSTRCYKKAWPLEKILHLFQKEKAKQFDPNLITLFLANLDKFLKIQSQFKDNI
ncbi:response regulator [Sulfurimonas sp. SAG-AH-194-I05]|nr:HD domain-containing phosphohydrolase [Sulfurimonas sp. SAG-AH-194-I05]MDF1875328.1 response regulator [Sulfurimonas sp. SAG-AH-194-I05]